MKSWPSPVNKKELKQFLGFAGFYRRFVEGFAMMAKPLHNLLKESVPFSWGEEEDCIPEAKRCL